MRNMEPFLLLLSIKAGRPAPACGCQAALPASVRLGTGLAVQPALNEGLCVDKWAWCVHSGNPYMAVRVNQSKGDQGRLPHSPGFLTLYSLLK